MPSEEWRGKQVVKDLCVVGHGRGATSYANAWLNRQGIRTNHERLGPQGIVESGFSVPTWGCRAGVHQGLTRDHFTFRHKIAIVRDPYRTIATYEQVEHPCAIFGHMRHVPGLLSGLVPEGWDKMSEAHQVAIAETDRQFRINVITRSVVRWTTMGINWCEGEFFRAEGQWEAEMPRWLKKRGLWTMPLLVARNLPKNTVNHRRGKRLDRADIEKYLHEDVQEELTAFREELGYE